MYNILEQSKEKKKKPLKNKKFASKRMIIIKYNETR